MHMNELSCRLAPIRLVVGVVIHVCFLSVSSVLLISLVVMLLLLLCFLFQISICKFQAGTDRCLFVRHELLAAPCITVAPDS